MKAILFAGQGSQQVGMGKDFYESYDLAKNFYDNLSSTVDIKSASFDADLETISKTNITQPVMIAFQSMVSELLKNEGIEFDYACGLSIGEYAALAQAEVLTSQEAVDIATKRGAWMQEIGESMNSKMVAVMGVEKDVLLKHLDDASQGDSRVEISNLNCPGQIVVSGDEAAVGRLEQSLTGVARRLIPLNTSGAFHTSYMKEVEDKLGELFEDIEFKVEKTKVAYNFTGGQLGDENVKDAMKYQVSHAVRFEECLEYMISQGVDTFVEVGFGGVLKGFIRKIDKTKTVYEINSVESYENFLKEVKND